MTKLLEVAPPLDARRGRRPFQGDPDFGDRRQLDFAELLARAEEPA